MLPINRKPRSILVFKVFALVFRIGRKAILCTAVVCAGLGCLVNAVLALTNQGELFVPGRFCYTNPAVRVVT